MDTAGRRQKKGGEDGMRKFFLIIAIVCFACIDANAQGEKQVRNGNKLYEQKKYKEASAAYQQALQKNPGYLPGMFNLGNSLYQQKQYDASRKVLNAAAKTSKDKLGKAGANYNIGNTYMSEQKWQEAVDAYKQALRNNPQDADAKYNLSYALQMLKKQQGGGGNDNKDNKDKNDKNKDQQNKDQQNKDKDNKDKDDQNKDQENKDNQGKPDQDKGEKDDQRPQPSKLSQQQAEQILNALQQEEKKLQDKMQKEKGIPVKNDKDW
jgi:Ca-activated chloride channel family protein